MNVKKKKFDFQQVKNKINYKQKIFIRMIERFGNLMTSFSLLSKSEGYAKGYKSLFKPLVCISNNTSLFFLLSK